MKHLFLICMLFLGIVIAQGQDPIPEIRGKTTGNLSARERRNLKKTQRLLNNMATVFKYGDSTIVDLRYIDWDLENGWTMQEGRTVWNEDDKTLETGLDGGSALQHGQEIHVRATNKTGENILDGAVVYLDSAQGNRPTISLVSDTSLTAIKTIGVATQDIDNNQTGYVTIIGITRGYDTRPFDPGALLWAGTEEGSLTSTRPPAGNTAVFVAAALNSTEDGMILVRPVVIQRLSWLSDVGARGNQAHNDILQWNNDSLFWESRDSIVIRVLDYEPPHGAMNFADSTTVIALTQNTWTKVTGPAGDLFMVRITDDITIEGDSITIEIAGDYMLWMSFSFDGVQNANFHIALYKNGGITDWEFHRKTSAQDTGNAGMPTYVQNLVAGDDLSIWIENTGNDGDAIMVSGQIVILMVHPR